MKDLSVDDLRRKAKWHGDHPKVGNQNLADSYARSALLKQRLGFQDRMESEGKSGPQDMHGRDVPVDKNNWPKGTSKWAFRE